jgi:heme exporter protein CcmD
MYFASGSEFLAMGGHGFYVWLSYSLMLLSLCALIIGSRLSQQRWLVLQRRRRQIAQQHSSRKPAGVSARATSSQPLASSPVQER